MSLWAVGHNAGKGAEFNVEGRSYLHDTNSSRRRVFGGHIYIHIIRTFFCVKPGVTMTILCSPFIFGDRIPSPAVLSSLTFVV